MDSTLQEYFDIGLLQGGSILFHHTHRGLEDYFGHTAVAIYDCIKEKKNSKGNYRDQNKK